MLCFDGFIPFTEIVVGSERLAGVEVGNLPF
jgi:hypothetical protein